MADFVRIEDWGLQAIVKGHRNSSDHHPHHHQSSCFMEMPKDYHHHHQSLFLNFPSLLDTASSFLTDELQELYKPFCSVDPYDFSSPNSQAISPVVSGSTAATPPPSSSFSVKKETKQQPEPPNHQLNQKVGRKAVSDDHVDSSSTLTATAYVPKYKKRKNQQKRVVMQVSAEELTSDKWAWRKYGQKPIKGSPYPRSYYRCSSSKGCLARKQVEQSCTDPGIFILTYTAEHCHSQPTRRNALAGTVRHRFGSTPKSPLAAKSGDSGICSTTLGSLPENLLVPGEESVERRIKKEEETDLPHDMETVDDLMFSRPEIVFDDDFFSCLNDLDGFVSELRDSHSSSSGNVSSKSHYL